MDEWRCQYVDKIWVWQVERAVKKARGRAIAFDESHDFHHAGRMANVVPGVDCPELHLDMAKELPHILVP